MIAFIEYLKQALDNEASVSAMRLCLLYGVFISSVIALLGIILNRDLLGTAALVGSILTPLSLGKGIQAKYENQPDYTNPKK